MDTTYIRKTKPDGRTYYARIRITPRQKLLVQQVVGSLLYYALAVDCTLLVALGDLAAVQTRATKDTMDKLVWLLNYVASNPNAEVTFVASDMCLHIHSDASYLSVSKVRSCAGAHFFLSKHPNTVRDCTLVPLNGPIHVVSKIIKFVMSSAAEAEIGVGFIATQ